MSSIGTQFGIVAIEARRRRSDDHLLDRLLKALADGWRSEARTSAA
ncbi:hypothetical protein [Rhodococcus sp. OK519]